MKITMTQLNGFADELVKIANLTPPVAPHVPPTSGPPPVAPKDQATPRGMSPIETKKPPKGGLASGKVSKYTKVHSVPTPGRSEGYQPVAGPPPVRS